MNLSYILELILRNITTEAESLKEKTKRQRDAINHAIKNGYQYRQNLKRDLEQTRDKYHARTERLRQAKLELFITYVFKLRTFQPTTALILLTDLG